MYVDPKSRKSGTGKKLVQAIVDHASDFVDLITLTVVSDNDPAIALYSDMGFRQYGTEPRALKVGTRYLAEVLMIRDLN